MTTVSEKNRERILEAIDQLRRRKARPDIQRICNYLFRKFSVNSSEAKADLQWCVDNNVVRKVEYKGSISYRNAAKKIVPAKQRDRDCHNDSSSNNMTDNQKVNRKFTQLLTIAFGELFVQEPDYLELGVPASDIISNILSKDCVRYTKNYINILLEKQVEIGGLIKMENGNYLMGPASDEKERHGHEWHRDDGENDPNANEPSTDGLATDDRHEFIIHLKPRKRPGPKPGFKKLEKLDGMDSDEKKSDNGILRVGGRRKRAKKVFDPSDTHVPKKRGRPAGSLNKSTIEKQLARLNDDYRPESRSSSSGREQGGVCSVCHVQNKKGPNDRMVSCRECSNKAHFSCLNNGDDMMLKMYPDNTWQCPHCKTCVVCVETSDSGYLTVCSVCADGYHATCHQPRISEKAKGSQQWMCINCQMPDELKINEIQSNIGSSFNSKNTSNDGNDNSSASNSSNSTPSNYSPPMSPTPPRLSPQTALPDSPDHGAGSDSQSNKDSEDNNKDYDDNIDPSIPDASGWTYEEVYQYFAQYFPEEANIFREQEIDGRSLLLLKRIDVLTNLKLKLGPALKIYKHVAKLQVRRDDPKMYWL